MRRILLAVFVTPLLALYAAALLALYALVLLSFLIAPAHAWTHGTGNAAKPLGKFAFFFSNGNADNTTQFDNWIANPTSGATAVSLGSSNTAINSTEVAKIHNAGLAYYYNDGDDCGSDLSGCEGGAQIAKVVPIDAVWFNEPAQCSSGTNASNWNTGFGAWYAIMRPGALAGISDAGSTTWSNCQTAGVTQQTLGQLEVFTNNVFTVTNSIDSVGLHGVVLLYGTQEFCTNGPSQMPDAQFDTVAFWDVDDYIIWAGSTLDDNWLANAEAYASQGSSAAKALCALPFSFADSAPSTSANTTANFSFTISDYIPTGFGSNTLGTCQYQVMTGASVGYGNSQTNGATVSLPWTTRACGTIEAPMTLNITIGSGGNCNVSNHGTATNLTCYIMFRALTSGSNTPGDVGAIAVPVDF